MTLSILLIDDDAVDRKQIIRTLKQSGVQCSAFEASTLAEGLAFISEKQFDCVLIDYRLPEEDGLTALAQIHDEHPYVPVIMVTGQGDESVAVQAIQKGAQHYVTKGAITPESLLHCVNNAIHNSAMQQRLDEQRLELESFAQVLAHDLKAPSRIIRCFVELIQNDLKEQKYSELERYMDRVKKSADQLDLLVDTLRQYTALDREVTFERVSMESIAHDVSELLGLDVSEKKAEIIITSLPEVEGNAPQLQQLLQNLINNGLKYNNAAMPRITISGKPNNTGWEFCVEDNGIGIPPEQHARIFEPFKRLHTHDSYPGSGLGLATCVKIVKRHGGKIWCDSKDGDGARFYFTLSPQRGRVHFQRKVA
ncbi:MAG: response regulator [Alphaproteobacteria bacterium]|nr:response regulator [Alphaproteobacteria bacterium]